MDKSVGAGEFKQTCLALLDEVAATHRSVVITKRGRPVARLVPIESTEEQRAITLGALRGKGRLLVSPSEFVKPLDDAGWGA